MAGPSANVLQAVQGYVSNYALSTLESRLSITRTMDAYFDGWQDKKIAGTRGGSLTVKKPTRFAVTNSLSFDTTASGAFTEREMTVTVDQQALVNYAAEDTQISTYKDLLNTNNKSAVYEIASTIEVFNATTIGNAGYRFVGSPSVSDGQLQNIGEIYQAIRQFSSFGVAGSQMYMVLPPMQSANIEQSMYQQFLTQRNEKVVLKGEIGQLRGDPDPIILYSSYLPVHTSGTVSTDTVNTSTGFTIDTITPTAGDPGTTVLVLSGFTADGGTFLENDVIDIGVLDVVNTQVLRFLTYSGYHTSSNPVQSRVTIGGTVSGGTVSITVEPALIYDGTRVDPTRNLSRDIDVTNDKVRVAQSHRSGLMYFKDYTKFAMADLPDPVPYPGKTVRSGDTNISMRGYYGHIMGEASMQFIHDAFYGNGTAAEGIARMLFPFIIDAV